MIFFPKDDNLGVLKSIATTCAGVWGWVGVGACSAAGRGGAASPGPGRAGFLKIFQIRFQIPFQIRYPDPGQRPFPIWKSMIDRFYNSKRGLWGRSSWKWLFSLSKTHSGRMFFISFWGDPILSTQRIPRGRDLILSTQRLPRGRDRIFSTQRIFYKKNHEKSMVCFKKISALRALIC